MLGSRITWAKKSWVAGFAVLVLVSTGASQLVDRQTTPAVTDEPAFTAPGSDENALWYEEVRDTILEDYFGADPAEHGNPSSQEKRRLLIGGFIFSSGAMGTLFGQISGHRDHCTPLVRTQWCGAGTVQSPSQ